MIGTIDFTHAFIAGWMLGLCVCSAFSGDWRMAVLYFIIAAYATAAAIKITPAPTGDNKE